MLSILYLMLESLALIVPILLVVAWVTILESKVLAATQSRVGPNSVGYYGILQPFSDALKLMMKETVVPGSANKVLFYLAPLIAIIVSLLGWAVIPMGQGLVMSDFSMGVLYTLTLSSMGVYGILFAGWSANSKYAFLGSMRASAAMMSYELILSSSMMVMMLLTGSFNYMKMIEAQQSIWFIVPLAPVFILFFISMLAETSSTPFDLQEAESELVAGFFTEHSSIIFVFYFLAEYSSIVLFSAVTSILFLGGYNFPELFINKTFLNIQSMILGLKTCLICFTFIWFSATFPRVRFDQIIIFCWTALLPVIMAFILVVPCLLMAFDIMAV